ncbi:IS30 family transposase [Bifidobacterium breve]|nr:IS30 family transposase [Bifidobacterium breve]
MLAYLADPYSSYQRGSNENRNGRIRRYLPTSLDNLTDADRQAIVQEINDTPMKVPDWETPNEAWYRKLGKLMSKTSHPQTNVALTNR